MSNKALSNKELELTQRLQMHFPRGRVPVEVLDYLNSCPKEILEGVLVTMCHHAFKKLQRPILLQLYVGEIIIVDGCRMLVYELAETADAEKMFKSLGRDLESLWMRTTQREGFCRKYPDKLWNNGQEIFFLHKVDEAKPAIESNLFVTDASIVSGGLEIRNYEFEEGRIWGKHYSHRVVVPEFGPHS